MSENFVRETELQRKEAELEQVIQEYYRYDMSGLKVEIKKIFEKETGKVDEERHMKLKEIEQKFKTLHKLSADHVSRGTRHRGGGADEDMAADDKLLQDFERYSEDYETAVKQANVEKQGFREEINQAEQEVRGMRDLLANKETENKNLAYLLKRESELQQEKTYKEEDALRLLNDDLSYQLKAIESQNEATGGFVTTKRMEDLLRHQYTRTIEGYDKFVRDSQEENEQVQRELSLSQAQLERELQVTHDLKIQKAQNGDELHRVGAEYSQLETELNDLTSAFSNKQRELDDLRVQAGDDARKLATELSQAQQTTNILILEVKKYEGLHKFMDQERELIMKAQKDSEGLNPAITSLDVEQAENRQRELEAQIAQISEAWQEKLNAVRSEAEVVLNQTELKEFQTRINILNRELEDKQKEIEQISQEKQRINETMDKTMDLEIDLKDQTEEIDILNNRYRRALKDKVTVYDELLNAVRMLAERNGQFMTNEIEISKMVNLTSITKKELEQKEKIHQELKASIDGHEQAATLAEKSDSQIAAKQTKVEELSNELHEKDKMIDQLKGLLRVREAQEQSMQQDMDEQARNRPGNESDKIKKQKFAPQQIRSGAAQGEDAGAPVLPRNELHVFMRGSYAPQAIDPSSHFLDARIVENLQETSLPFPLRKLAINNDQEEGGAWYIFGTRLVLIREYDEDVLQLQEYKSSAPEELMAYLGGQQESEWNKIQNLLRTKFQHLLELDDPVQALSEEFVKTYERELGLD